jgi:hypothetical protein
MRRRPGFDPQPRHVWFGVLFMEKKLWSSSSISGDLCVMGSTLCDPYVCLGGTLLEDGVNSFIVLHYLKKKKASSSINHSILSGSTQRE